MSFLAPLFLLGATAIALPIIFHLIRRSSRERTPFSSLMFLLPTPPRVTRRSRIENVFLLLLRCLVLCLLAFAFARPFLSRPMAPDPAAQSGARVLVLLDASASMRREGLWAEAQARARAAFREATAADQVACATFGGELRSVFGFEEWSTLPAGERVAWSSGRVDQLKPGWEATRLGNALITAAELFEVTAKDEHARKRIILITDLQEGSRLDGLQGFEWPRGLTVTVEALRAKHPTNAGLQLALDREESAASGEPVTRVRISNSPGSQGEQFQIGWRLPGQPPFPTMDTYIPPGQSRVLPVPRPPGPLVPDRLVLTGDQQEFDNTVYVAAPQTEEIQIVYLGGDAETDANRPLFYLKRAFQGTRSLAVQIRAYRPGVLVPAEQLAQASLVIATEALPEDQIGALTQALGEGKGLLFVLTGLEGVPTLARLIGEGELRAAEASGASYSMLGQIDFEHPLFAPFADPRYSDFTKIHFWKYRQLQLGQVAHSRVLARFDHGDPALAEIASGKGRVWVLTSGWQPEDSQLALSSKFVPLLYAMLELSGGPRDQRAAYFVGDPVTFPPGSDFVTVRKPDASEVRVAGGEKFSGSDQPGLYEVVALQPPLTFAVNVAPEESRTAPMPLEELERLGVPLTDLASRPPAEVQARREHLHATQLEQRQKLWRWLIVAGLVVLVMETWLAGRVTRRAVPATP